MTLLQVQIKDVNLDLPKSLLRLAARKIEPLGLNEDCFTGRAELGWKAENLRPAKTALRDPTKEGFPDALTTETVSRVSSTDV